MVYVIDGLDGIEACYHFAGIVGIRPHGMTLRQLWMMANGKIRQRRCEIVESASLVWGESNIDLQKYVYFGTHEDTGIGGPLKLDPEMQSRVEARIEEIRRDNPELPAFKGTR